MNKNLIVAVVGAVVPAVMAGVFGYWAWISYSDFVNWAIISNWDPLYLMMVTLFVSGFFVGMVFVAIPMLYSMRQSAKKEQEKQKLREEIKRELEMEAQKKVDG